MSKIFSVDSKQWINGLVMVLLGAIIGGAIDILNSILNGTSFDIKATLITALVCGLAYIKKSFISNQDGEFLKK